MHTSKLMVGSAGSGGNSDVAVGGPPCSAAFNRTAYADERGIVIEGLQKGWGMEFDGIN